MRSGNENTFGCPKCSILNGHSGVSIDAGINKLDQAAITKALQFATQRLPWRSTQRSRRSDYCLHLRINKTLSTKNG